MQREAEPGAAGARALHLLADHQVVAEVVDPAAAVLLVGESPTSSRNSSWLSSNRLRRTAVDRSPSPPGQGRTGCGTGPVIAGYGLSTSLTEIAGGPRWAKPGLDQIRGVRQARPGGPYSLPRSKSKDARCWTRPDGVRPARLHGPPSGGGPPVGHPRPTVYELFGRQDQLFAAVVDDSAERIVGRPVRQLRRVGGWELAEASCATTSPRCSSCSSGTASGDRAAQRRAGGDRPADARARPRCARRCCRRSPSSPGPFGGAPRPRHRRSAEIMALIFFRMAEALAVRRISEPGVGPRGVHRPAHPVHVGGHQPPLAAVAGRADRRGPAHRAPDAETPDPDEEGRPAPATRPSRGPRTRLPTVLRRAVAA